VDDFLLGSRAALRRAFFRLTGTAEDDDALTEHDAAPLEAVHQHLQHGLWRAQRHMIGAGLGHRWRKVWKLTAADAVRDGDTYSVALPEDFLRLAATERESGIVSGGRAWGRLLAAEGAAGVRGGDVFYLAGDRLHLTSAVPYAGLDVTYHYRHPLLVAEDTPIDFPEEDRPLIVAFAADGAKHEAWLPGGSEMLQKIALNLRDRMQEAARNARQTREPAKLRPPAIVGAHWFL
jgi:hypothetical protein